MASLPAGARVQYALLTIDNEALDTTGAAQVSVQLWTGGQVETGDNGEQVLYITSASADNTVRVFAPNHAGSGYVTTASSNVVLNLTHFVDSGTASTVFALALTYDCQKAP
jgi:hypothetical protein